MGPGVIASRTYWERKSLSTAMAGRAVRRLAGPYWCCILAYLGGYLAYSITFCSMPLSSRCLFS